MPALRACPRLVMVYLIRQSKRQMGQVMTKGDLGWSNDGDAQPSKYYNCKTIIIKIDSKNIPS